MACLLVRQKHNHFTALPNFARLSNIPFVGFCRVTFQNINWAASDSKLNNIYNDTYIYALFMEKGWKRYVRIYMHTCVHVLMTLVTKSMARLLKMYWNFGNRDACNQLLWLLSALMPLLHCHCYPLDLCWKEITPKAQTLKLGHPVFVVPCSFWSVHFGRVPGEHTLRMA